MNTKTYVALISLIAIILIGVGTWQILSSTGPEENTEAAPEAVQKEAKQPAPAEETKPPAEPEEPPAETIAKADPAPVPAEPEKTPEAPAKLTAETLKDTTWKEGKVTAVFHADGSWEMNGRVCAKWEVLDDKIRVYDDEKKEEHFIDIVGDSLVFNGKKIGRAPKE